MQLIEAKGEAKLTNDKAEELLKSSWRKFRDPMILTASSWCPRKEDFVRILSRNEFESIARIHRAHFSHGNVNRQETNPRDQIHPDQACGATIDETDNGRAKYNCQYHVSPLYSIV